MSYKKYFVENEEYQNIINQFEEKKKAVAKAVEAGATDKKELTAAVNKVAGDLQYGIHNYHTKRVAELEKKQNELANEQPEIDYTSNKAENYRIKFKLADDYKLKEYAQDITGDDLTEMNLLRLELRKRGLKQEDDRLKRITIGQQTEYQDSAEFKETVNELSALKTMGASRVVYDDRLPKIEDLQKEFTNELFEAAERGAKRRNRSLQDVIKNNHILSETLQG